MGTPRTGSFRATPTALSSGAMAVFLGRAVRAATPVGAGTTKLTLGLSPFVLMLPVRRVRTTATERF